MRAPVIAAVRTASLRTALPGAALLTLLAVTVAGYAPSLDGDFLFDDATSIATNPRVRGWDGFAAGFSLPESLARRPVTDLTFAFDAARSGLRPRAFHETSLILHVALTLLLLVFTRTILRRAGAAAVTWAPVAVAALFAVHPIQTQAVAYAAQRAELLSSLLAVATLLLLLLADRSPSRPRAFLWGGAALVTFALAAGSKMVAAVVPALFLLALLWFPAESGDPAEPGALGATARSRWLRRLALLAPLAALTAVQVAVFFDAMRGNRDVGFSVPGLDPWRYLLTQARVIPLYLRLIAWPTGQNLDHEIAPSAGIVDPPSTIAGGLFLLLLLGAAVWGLLWTRGRGRTAPAAPAVRAASFGIVWFLVLLAPTSSVVPLADVVAEHRVYLASWGLIAGAVALVGLAIRRLPAATRGAAAAGLAIFPTLALATALHARATLWGDPMALWRDAAGKSPGRARPQVNMGDELYERGDLDGAIAAYGRAVAIAPGTKTEPVLQRIASALLSRQRAGEARALLARIPSPEPETVVLQTLASVELGDLAEAERYAWQLVVRASTYARSHEAMGRVLEAKGDLAGARDSYRRAAALAPGSETLRRLGRMELQLGDRAGCTRLARAAASIDNPWVARWAAADARQAGCPP